MGQYPTPQLRKTQANPRNAARSRRAQRPARAAQYVQPGGGLRPSTVAFFILLAVAVAATAYFIYHMITLLRMHRELSATMAEMDDLARMLAGSLAQSALAQWLPASFYVAFGVGVLACWLSVFTRRPLVSLVAAAAFIVALVIQPKLALPMGLLAAFSAVGYLLLARTRGIWI